MSAMMKEEKRMEPFMGFIQDDITTRSLRDVVSARGWNITRVFEGGITEAIQTLQTISTPQLLVIDMTGAQDPVASIEELAGVCESGVKLLCLGTTNDVGLYRDLLDMGVEDYLLKPVDPEALEHAVERACYVPEENTAVEPEIEGEVISVIGALGGVGATSIATNVAWEMSQHKGKRVALVDMDLHFGTIALSLDLEPGKGFREALENPSRIDSLFLDRAMVKVNDQLSILASETDVSTLCSFDAQAVDLLVERLRQKFDLVILDVPRHLMPMCGELLASLGKLLMISDMSLAGMRDSLRLSRYVKDLMAKEDLLIVANRVGENKDRELSQKEFEKGIDLALNGLIPFDPKGCAQSDLQGSPLMKVAKKSRAALAQLALVDALAPVRGEVKEKGSFLSRIFKGK